jgi:uncharacterized protein
LPQETRAGPITGPPFHAAELALQERFGRRARLESWARRGIRNYLIDQHRAFFPQLPFLLIGSADSSGQPWASMLAAPPGFAWAPDPYHLRVDARPTKDDPLTGNLQPGSAIAVLGIELPTRRRNRVNGRLTLTDSSGFTVAVDQSYGNCPQYIQAVDLTLLGHGHPHEPQPPLRYRQLTSADRDLIRNADTFYIATVNLNPDAGPARGADVSHRGGRPGFIRIDDDTLTAPDFIGNFFFNTLGNLMIEPRAGLLFADFKTGDLLLLATRAEVVWDGPEVTSFAGAQRLIRFQVTEVIRLNASLPFRGSQPRYAPELARTGTWQVEPASE